MGEKQCGKCGETVDEAKAFCPGCGNAFVEEKTRTSVSDFDLSDNTVRLGDTMYNQMLSDMGLSISRQQLCYLIVESLCFGARLLGYEIPEARVHKSSHRDEQY